MAQNTEEEQAIMDRVSAGEAPTVMWARIDSSLDKPAILTLGGVLPDGALLPERTFELTNDEAIDFGTLVGQATVRHLVEASFARALEEDTA
jgi:hypothetical protein